MDHIDLKILDILQSDGRITMKELGIRVGLTSPATIERVKKLEENGIINGYKAIINVNKAGLPVRAFILLTAASDKQQDVVSFVRDNDSIINCHRIAGGSSHLLETVVADFAGLESLLDGLSGLGMNTQPFIILSSPVEYKNVVLPEV